MNQFYVVAAYGRDELQKGLRMIEEKFGENAVKFITQNNHDFFTIVYKGTDDIYI